MNNNCELIVAIVNHGFEDEVMTAARSAEGKYYIIGVFGASTGSARFADAAKLIDYALGRRS